MAALCLNPSLPWISVVTVPKRAHQHPKRRSEPRVIDSTVILMTRLSLTMNSQSLLAEAAGSYFRATATDPRKQLYPGLMRDGIFPHPVGRVVTYPSWKEPTDCACDSPL